MTVSRTYAMRGHAGSVAQRKRFEKLWRVKDGRPSDWVLVPNEADWVREWEVLCEMSDVEGHLDRYGRQPMTHPDFLPERSESEGWYEEALAASDLSWREHEALELRIHGQYSFKKIKEALQLGNRMQPHRAYRSAVSKVEETLERHDVS